MSASYFETFFTGAARAHLERAIELALDEDGRDLTSEALFAPGDILDARIVAKQSCVAAGLPILDLVLARCAERGSYDLRLFTADGERVARGSVVATLRGPAAPLLKAERVLLNFLTHLSGIATLTATYVERIAGTGARLLDTRKTLPGLRYPEKYAVRMGGGTNHRVNLEAMLMLKDNHVDRAGSITRAVATVRAALSPCPPIEVECRTEAEVREAAACGVDRIMLDNMETSALRSALALVPEHIETEVSGNVTLETIRAVAEAGPDFISVGRITHSAPSADFSMQIVGVTVP
ncbi:MAG: carboxylating nicotinate-nucleotide diphosphorylase [Desulfovibrionaceae bacterium]|jgi:nicotinate-nucleotide pyrophosphorylase (carboxylating)|nr:carboxylating nicotinate-nucleotide diphosphorylase [Desulfovibrionaceae bacterium]